MYITGANIVVHCAAMHCTALHKAELHSTICSTITIIYAPLHAARHGTARHSTSPQHCAASRRLFQVLGGLGIAVYLVGFPLMTVLALSHISKNKLHCDKSTIALWGALYTKYEAPAWW